MNKALILFVILNYFQNLAFGQLDTLHAKTNDKMVLSFSGGAALPFGVFDEFEKTEATIDNGKNIAGGALIGYYGKVDFKYYFAKNFGLLAIFYSSVNNASDPGSDFVGSGIGDGNGLGGGATQIGYSYKTNIWQTNSVLVGLNARPKIGFFNFDIWMSLGLQQVNSPETILIETGYTWGWSPSGNYSFTIETRQPKMTSYNFVANIGIGGAINLSGKFKLKIGFEGLFSQASFEASQTIISDDDFGNGNIQHYEKEQSLNFKKSVSVFCLGVGICYVLK